MKRTIGKLAEALFIIAWILAGILWFGAGVEGLEQRCGKPFGWLGFLVAGFTGFGLPLSVGVFYLLRDAWKWPWYFALLGAAPLAVPLSLFGLMGAAYERFRNLVRGE